MWETTTTLHDSDYAKFAGIKRLWRIEEKTFGGGTCKNKGRGGCKNTKGGKGK